MAERNRVTLDRVIAGRIQVDLPGFPGIGYVLQRVHPDHQPPNWTIVILDRRWDVDALPRQALRHFVAARVHRTIGMMAEALAFDPKVSLREADADG